MATEYEYHHDPDELQKQKRMDALDKHHKSCVTDRPFKPSNPPKKGKLYTILRESASSDCDPGISSVFLILNYLYCM